MQKSSPGRRNGQRTTIQDIARQAGVSPATVSLVLNDKGSINARTRERVKAIARQLDYVPNPMAQALRGGRTNTIGVVINHLHNPFFSGVFRGIEQVADRKGLTFLVSHTHDDLDKERRQVRLMAERGVDGLIVLPCSNESGHLESVRAEFNLPVVLIGNFFEGKDFSSVVADNWNGTTVVVEHLISLGRRPIVHIAGPDNQTMCLFRRRAFEQTLAEAYADVLPADRVWQVPAMTPDQGYRIMPRILERLGTPLSLFVVNDDTALGVLRYCAEHGLAMPGDIAIAGFSDIEILGHLNIPLTTVRIPALEMGVKAADMLIQAMDGGVGGSSLGRVVLPVELVVRSSTKLDPA